MLAPRGRSSVIPSLSRDAIIGGMGREPKGGAIRHRKPGQPRGGAWEALRRHLWAKWRANHTPCFHCGDPDHDQIEHLISTQRRPDLGMDESNLVPTHSVCPHCFIACNTVAGSNSAERDSRGRSVPFSPAFKRQKSAEAAANGRKPRNPPRSPAVRPSAIGREW